ncbi:hypothetical protein L6164_036582 [Bauhinia variegata]|uniref:Uncharacterized protein n=1 Tax=Bauhinia variegata TaxID=167791 RepID=A0ACB9KHH0_BAUVA|nr:hypothetical protein L6164_036582 [Bauhinia variegata]
MAVNIIGIVTGVMSCLCAQNSLTESLLQHYKHFRRPKKNLNKLKSSTDELIAWKEDLTVQLELIWLEKGMKPKPGVTLWLENVDKMEGQVNRFITKIEEKAGSSGGFSFSSCFVCSRIKLGELIEEKISEMVELLEGGQFVGDSLAEMVPKKGHIIPTTRLMMHETTMETITRIWEFLCDDSVRKIGVYGMGGVGKTTIMSEINNRLLKDDVLFDCVIWVTVPMEIDLENLQTRIAEKVGVDLSEFQDETARAAVLFEALERRQKFAMVLDGLWEPFSLEKVGIPIPTIENGCKLLITTRLVSVCRGMETDQEVEVKILTENEAWNLFRDKVGDQVLASPNIHRFAQDVAKECMGLPLGIVTMGRALRNVADILEWENALAVLRLSTADIRDMEEMVFSQLRYSFTKLKDDTSRSCFLYCALYPKGHIIDINELIEYWMWEGLLGSMDSISTRKQKGRIILNELRYACLVETATQNGKECVRLHDLIRDMAIKIMSTSPHWIVKAGIGLTNPPDIDEWVEDVQRVSLMRNHLKSIPVSYLPRCPRLTCLLLQYNPFPKNIHSFFDFMPSLKLLDLSHTGIDSLPESLSNLENLRALLLCNCWNLREVPSLAKLSKLMYLDLSCSQNIKELPQGSEHLGNLRRLNISSTEIQCLPSGFVSELTYLEELWACNSNLLKEGREVSTEKATIEEIISSSALSSLEVDFWSFKLYDLYAKSDHWAQLGKFKFVVGLNHPREYLLEERSIAFQGILFHNEPPIIPENTIELKLCDCADITQLTTCLLNVKQLKSCTVINCGRIECIAELAQNDLSKLETMVLKSLVNLQYICRGLVSPSTLISLKCIIVEHCPNLRNLFSSQLLFQLINLEEIRASHCDNMEELIRGDEEANLDSAKIHLPQLHKLRLEFMPKLKCIYDGSIRSSSLRSIEVVSCDALSKLPLDLDENSGILDLASPDLEIKGSAHWWESLKWDKPAAKQNMQDYFVELSITSNESNEDLDFDHEDSKL